MAKKIRKAVIPSAGFGTRFLPQTKAMPKEMLPLVDKPVIQFVVEELVDAGITDIILVTGYHKKTIEDHFDAGSKDLVDNLMQGGEKKRHLLEEVERISQLANFVYVRQKGPYGNGTPLLNVRHLIGNEPFIYTWSDDFIVSNPSRFKQMIEVYAKYEAPILGGVRAKEDGDYDKYGFAGGDELEEGVLEVNSLIEKPGKENAPSNLATVSGFIFTPNVFDYLDQVMEDFKEGDEFYYNDALKLMLEDQKRIVAMEIKGGKFYDTGNKLEYMKTVVEFALKHKDISDDFRKYLRQLDLG